MKPLLIKTDRLICRPLRIDEASINLIRKLGFVEDANPESAVMNHSDLHFIIYNSLSSNKN